MEAAPTPSYDFTVQKGIPYLMQMIYKDAAQVPVDLTGYTGEVTIVGSGSTGKTSVSVAVSFGPGGSISFVVDSTHFQFQKGAYALDVIPPGGLKQRLLRGTVQVEALGG